MKTNTAPSPELIAKAWNQLKCRDCGFDSRQSFIKRMTSDELHYFPIMITNGDLVEALIYFDKYDPYLRICHAHFITANYISNPRAIMRDAKKVIDGVMVNGDIGIMFAFIPNDRPRVIRIAKHLGFKAFAVNQAHIGLSLELDLI